MSAPAITKAPCRKCPFRKDVPIYLRRERREQIRDSLVLEDSTFYCHETVEYGEDEDGEPEGRIGDATPCAGAAKALMLSGGSTNFLRVSERLGLLDLDEVAARGPDVWELNEWARLAEGATADDPEEDPEAEVETCSVVWGNACEAPAGYLGGGGGVVMGTVAAGGTCPACGDPVCSACRHGDDGPCYSCVDPDDDPDDY